MSDFPFDSFLSSLLECEEHGDYVDQHCTNVKHIEAAELSTHRVLLFTTGHLVTIAPFNEKGLSANKEYFSVQVTEKAGDSIKHFESIVYDDELYMVAHTSKSDELYLIRWKGESSPLPTKLYGVPEAFSVMEMFVFTGNRFNATETLDDGVFLALLMKKRDDSREYRLQFTRIDGTNPSSDTWHWSVRSSSPVGMSVSAHHGAFADPTFVLVQQEGDPKRVLFLLYNDVHVQVLAFNPSHGSMPDINLDAETGRNILYDMDSATGKITKAVLFGDKLKAYDEGKSSCMELKETPIAEDMYLVVAHATAQGSHVDIRHLPEFRHFDFASKAQTVPATNPLDRSVDCTGNEFHHSGHCDSYGDSTVALRTEGTIRFMEVRFIYPPNNVVSINGPSDEDIEANCLLISKGSRALLEACKQIQGSSKGMCSHEVMQQSGDDISSQSLYSAIFVVTDQDEVKIAGAQRDRHENGGHLYIESMNSVELAGPASDLYVSQNGAFLYTPVAVKRYVIDSLRRQLQVCSRLKEDPDNVFLKPFVSVCNYELEESVNLYGNQLSMCPFGVSCPSPISNHITATKEGEYTELPNIARPCPEGYFCREGLPFSCVEGFQCPDKGMSLPRRCEGLSSGNTTCFHRGTQSPAPCDEGAICVRPYMPPIPAPPGYFIAQAHLGGDAIRKTILPCKPGEWCNIGRETSLDRRAQLNCPAGTSCPSPSVVEPKVCDCALEKCSFCPAGTVTEEPCPAGYYCKNPLERQHCSLGQHCPSGTFFPKVCPAGYHCPTPAELIRCPEGHFCKAGSVKPKPCPPLTHCPEGTESDSNPWGFIVIAVIAIAVVVGSIIIECIRARTNALLLMIALKRSEEKSKGKGRLSWISSAPESVALESDAFSAAISQGETLMMDDDHSQILLTEQHDEQNDMEMQSTNYEAMDGEPESELGGVFMDIAFKDLGLVLNSGKPVLHGVNGELLAGTFTAVMGPSGSGKSTFVTTLSDRAFYGKRRGRIYINGKEDSLSKHNDLMGFVPQEDIMTRTTTVEETIYFAARTKLPWRTSNAKCSIITHRLINDLGLHDVRSSRIGDEEKRGISGGQRKRVNIALELVNNPRVLFLDEPTSGLDSTSSMEVCTILRDTAKKKKMVICAVLHQPRYEIFQLFTNVLLLGKGGRVVYFGPSKDCLAYFESIGFHCPPMVNPPDFFMDVIGGFVEREGDPTFVKEDLFKLWEEYQATKGIFTTLPDEHHANRSFSSRQRYTPPPSSPTPNTLKTLTTATTSINVTEQVHGDDEQSVDAEKAIDVESKPLGDTQVSTYDKERALRYQFMDFKKEKKKRRTLFIVQLWPCIKRPVVQQLRDIFGLLIEFGLLFISAFFIGLVHLGKEYIGPFPDHIVEQCPESLQELCGMTTSDPILTLSFLTTLALSLAGVMSSLNAFGNGKVVHARESQGGLMSSAYFIGQNIVHAANIVLGPIIYLAVFFAFIGTRAQLLPQYGIMLIIYFTAYGYGYLVSLLLKPSNAKVFGVVSTLVFGIFSGAVPTLKDLHGNYLTAILSSLSWLRWGQQALYVLEVIEYRDVYKIEKSLDQIGYISEPGYMEVEFWLSIFMIINFGILFRSSAFLVLKAFKETSYISRAVRKVRGLIDTVKLKVYRVIDTAIQYVGRRWKQRGASRRR